MGQDQDQDDVVEEVYISPLKSRDRPVTDVSQRLKAALWFSIGKIVDEETLKLGVNASPQFIGALTEMAWAQMGDYFR